MTATAGAAAGTPANSDPGRLRGRHRTGKPGTSPAAATRTHRCGTSAAQQVQAAGQAAPSRPKERVTHNGNGWAYRRRAAMPPGGSQSVSTWPPSPRVATASSSMRSGTASDSGAPCGQPSPVLLSAPQRWQAYPGTRPPAGTSSSWMACCPAAARQALRPVTVRPSGGSRRNSAAMCWSCRFPQSWMTRPARSRTFAGVRVCGSATKLPAKWSRSPAGRMARNCGIVFWWPAMMSGSAPLARAVCSSSVAVSW